VREFKDRVAVITGAGSGIGRELARALAAEGAHLALSDIHEDRLVETKALVESASVKVSTERVDVSDRAAVFAHADQVMADHGRVNLVFNNAGVAMDGNIADLGYEDFSWLMGINFWGVVNGTQAFLPHLKASGAGHVINISSLFGLIAVPGQSAYHSAKFAVRGFTECLRQELEVEGAPVSATSVHPGGIKTNIARDSRVTSEGPDVPSREEMHDQFTSVALTTPERAARVILKGVRRNKRRVLIGPDTRVADGIQRLFPTAYQRLVIWAARRANRATS